MTTLWIFGDNYSAYWPEEIKNAPQGLQDIYQYFKKENTWPYIVANEINSDVKNYALGFSSLEYLFKKFNEVKNNIKQGDSIVITLIGPDIVSRNFVRDNPFKISHETDFSKMMFHDQDKYISRNEAHLLYIDNFLYNLKDLTINLNLNTIVIGSLYGVESFLNTSPEHYFPVNIAEGSLQDITINEYDEETKQKAYYFGDDSFLKTNWLTQSNHKILAEKIIANIKNRSIINLSRGFKQGIISEENRRTIKFISSEY